MSNKSDLAMTRTVISMLDRRQIQLLEEYADLLEDASDFGDAATSRDLRLQKSGAIVEVKHLKDLLQEVVDEVGVPSAALYP